MVDILTLDQIRVFIAVAEAGSFSSAAKLLNRAQSAVTYAIQKLEGDTGFAIFDRSAYRPVLTDAGRALLVRARRIAEEANAFRDQARGLAQGLEPELAISMDPLFPMSVLVDVLKALSERFPSVLPRVHVRPMGAAAQLVIDGSCAIGLVSYKVTEVTSLTVVPMLEVDLVPVAAPGHPLAMEQGLIAAEVLHRHVQLVLSDPSGLTAGQDYGVMSTRTWRLADLGVKKAMLLAGLGWGNMPDHLVADELDRGTLKRIAPAEFSRMTGRLVLGCTHSPSNAALAQPRPGCSST